MGKQRLRWLDQTCLRSCVMMVLTALRIRQHQFWTFTSTLTVKMTWATALGVTVSRITKKKKTQTQSGDVRLCCLSFFLSFFSQFCHCLQSVHELYVEQKRLINCLFHTAEDTSFLTPWTDCRIICVKMWGFEKLCSELIASGNIRCRRMLDKYFVMEVCSSLHTRRGHSQTTEVFSPSLFLGWFLTFVNACSQK